MANLEAHYSARDIEVRILAALRTAGLNPEQRLSPEALAALDQTPRSPRRDNWACRRSSTISDKRPRTRAAVLRSAKCGLSEVCSGCNE